MSIYKTVWAYCDWNDRFTASYKELSAAIDGRHTDYWGNLSGDANFGNGIPKRPARLDESSDTTYVCYKYNQGCKAVVFKTIKGSVYQNVVVSSGTVTNVGSADVVYGATVPDGGTLTVAGEAYDVLVDWGGSVTTTSDAIVTYIRYIDNLVLESGVSFEVPEKHLARYPVVSSGASLLVYGSAYNVTSREGATVSAMTDTAVITYISGSVTSDVDVPASTTLTVGKYDKVYGVTLSSGAILVVSGEAYDVFQEWGASVTVADGGVVTYRPFTDDMVVSSGVIVTIPDKGIARNPVISSGGSLLVYGSALGVNLVSGGFVSAMTSNAVITYA